MPCAWMRRKQKETLVNEKVSSAGCFIKFVVNYRKSLLHIEWRDDFMCQIALSIPDEVLYDTKMSREQANQFARQAVARVHRILFPDSRNDRRRIYQIFRTKSHINLPV